MKHHSHGILAVTVAVRRQGRRSVTAGDVGPTALGIKWGRLQLVTLSF